MSANVNLFIIINNIKWFFSEFNVFFRYLALKFQEMEEKMQKEKKGKETIKDKESLEVKSKTEDVIAVEDATQIEITTFQSKENLDKIDKNIDK